MPIDKEEAWKWFKKGFNTSGEGWNSEYPGTKEQLEYLKEELFEDEWDED